MLIWINITFGKGGKLSFPNFSYGEKKKFCQRGDMAQCPPKYATDQIYSRAIPIIPIHRASPLGTEYQGWVNFI